MVPKLSDISTAPSPASPKPPSSPQHPVAKDFSRTSPSQEPASPWTLIDTTIGQPTEQNHAGQKLRSGDKAAFCMIPAPTSGTRALSREVIQIVDDESSAIVIESSPPSGQYSENRGRKLLSDKDDEYDDESDLACVQSTWKLSKGRKRIFTEVDDQDNDEADVQVEEENELDFNKVDEILGGCEAETELETTELSYGTAFEKLEYEPCIDETNPWHPDLRRPLFPSQVIGDRWMRDRHLKHGGLVQDRVGLGKVYSPHRSVAFTETDI